MRDSQIMSELRRMETMVGHDVRALTEMVSRVSMRIDAIQRVLFGKRYSLFVALATSLVSPKLFEGIVDKMHVQVMAEFNAEMEKRRQDVKKAVIKPGLADMARHARNPGVIGLVLISLLMASGCVTTRHAKDEYARGLAESSAACEAELSDVKLDLVKKNARLRSFNQVDESGKLYPAGKK